MAQSTVRNVTAQVVSVLKRRAAARGRSAEAEHRDILRRALMVDEGSFADRARTMKQHLRSSVDSTETIRAARNRDGAA